MSLAQASQSASPRVTGSLLLLCIALSIAVHLGSAVGAGVYLSQRVQPTLGSSKQITLPDMPEPVQPPDLPMRLGRQDSSTASIAWLGVTRDPVLGEGQESTVEQAELTIVAGNAEEAAQAIPATPEQPKVVEVVPTVPTEQAAEAQDETQVAESQPEPTPEPLVEATTAPPEQAAPISIPADPQTSIIEESAPAETHDIPDAIARLSEPEPENPSEAQPNESPEPEPEPEPEIVTVPAQETPVEQVQAAPPQSATTPESQPPSQSQTQGKPGQVDDRESVASIIRRAQEVRATTLNQPLSGEGLEIKPIEPKFPASVRFTQLPRNPIVLIRFNAQGRVVKAQFLRDDEKKKVYDTGSKGVDEPLINAIYKWRASGKQLEALDPNDPESTIEISMKIIFRDD